MLRVLRMNCDFCQQMLPLDDFMRGSRPCKTCKRSLDCLCRTMRSQGLLHAFKIIRECVVYVGSLMRSFNSFRHSGGRTKTFEFQEWMRMHLPVDVQVRIYNEGDAVRKPEASASASSAPPPPPPPPPPAAAPASAEDDEDGDSRSGDGILVEETIVTIRRVVRRRFM